ncbi:YhgE/Pip domain-containing protein [Nocardioides humi]|uniref:YhgE/Pip domain-containing protein n=1 Tax=Nocardioides humi TaxID=449461 RepID=UPI0015E83E06|nr:ABC transporter permease [Nocardioides humi]
MDTRHTLGSRRTWLMPILIVVGLAAILPSIYLAGTVDPQGHLADMPVGLVVEQQTDGPGPEVAETVAAAIEAGAGETLAVTRMTRDELATAMQEDRVAGAVVIPADFDASIASLLPGAASVAVPEVEILTNAGDGGLSTGLLVGNLTPLLQGVADRLGERLLTSPAGTAPPAANVALLSQPFDIVSSAYEPLPDNTGMGMSAFYFSLVLVLIGFIGASLVGPLVDSSLGFIPSELGPLVARQPYTALSRRATFLAKVAILVTAAPLAALAIQLVAALFGVSVGDPVTLWLYSAAVIAAIGTSALAVFSVFGSGIGSLVNTLFFVALAMVSSGAPCRSPRRRRSSAGSPTSRPTGTSSTAPDPSSTSTGISTPASAARGSAWLRAERSGSSWDSW